MSTTHMQLELQARDSNLVLNMIGSSVIEPTTVKFVAKDKFRKNSPEVNFSFIRYGFKARFIKKHNGKIEIPLERQLICHATVTQGYATLSQVINELGGGDKVETTLTAVWDQLIKHAEGKGNALLDNGETNYFFVWDSLSSELCAVSFYMQEYGWHINAQPILYPYCCKKGEKIFFRTPERGVARVNPHTR